MTNFYEVDHIHMDIKNHDITDHGREERSKTMIVSAIERCVSW